MAMTFTDDDLKQLKEFTESTYGHSTITIPELKALLARLEAAEKLCSLFDNGAKYTSREWILLLQPAYDNWYKVAGK